MQQAARITSLVMKNYFINEMSNFVDSNKKVSHERFALLIESTLLDERKRQMLKLPSEVLLYTHPTLVRLSLT